MSQVKVNQVKKHFYLVSLIQFLIFIPFLLQRFVGADWDSYALVGTYENFIKYKNIIFFMGSSGRKILNETLQEWDLDYEEKKSLTSNDSFILNIKKIKKKIS